MNRKFTAVFLLSLSFFFPMKAQTVKQALQDYNFGIKYIQNNYPGYQIKLNQNNLKNELKLLVSESRKKLKQYPDSLPFYVDKYVNSFHDGHLSFRLTKQGWEMFRHVVSHSDDGNLMSPIVHKFTQGELDSLDAKLHNSLDGIKVGKKGMLAIKRVMNTYVVFSLDIKGFPKGAKLGTFMATDKAGVYANNGDIHTPFDTLYCYNDNHFLELKKLGVFVKHTKDELYDKASYSSFICPRSNNNHGIMSSTAKAINDSTFFIRVPSFASNVANKLVENNWKAIISRPYLIIDIRDNPGGDDRNYSQLARLAYSKPYKADGVEMYATKDFLKLYQDEVKEMQGKGDMEGILFYQSMADSVKSHLGGFVLRPKEQRLQICSQDTIYPFPRKVGIMINERNGSAAEQFILDVRQSDKVILFGNENTRGCIDLSNIYPILFPSGWFNLWIPTTRTCRYPQQAIDGKGIAPQVPIPYPFNHQEYDRIGYDVYFVENYLMLSEKK